jgi:hypothetical protein
MRRLLPLLVGLAAAAALASCGSKRAAVVVETVTVTTPRTTSTQATTATTPTTPTQTRTATGPGFTGGTPATPSGALSAALASLSSRGFTPVSTSTYQPGDTLRVLIGRRSGAEQAFFFNGSRYLGTDASGTSRSISVVGQSDTQVSLRYATTSGPQTVRFVLDMGRLMALDSIPSSAARG